MASPSRTFEYPVSLSGVDKLDSQHREALTGAVLKLLGTDLAVETYGQIIDGVPLYRVAHGQLAHRIHVGHPIENHVALCPGVVDTARQFKAEFDMETLKFDTKLVDAFQASTPNSRGFQLRLIELVAVAAHRIAVLLYQQNMRLHDRHITNPRNSVDQTTWWKSRDEIINGRNWTPMPPWPTLFNHPQYVAHDQYPDGLADSVAYWAEAQLFGGVVVFDRSQPWNTQIGDGLSAPEPNFYLHPSGKTITRRLWQVKDEEQQALLDFLLSPAQASSESSNGPLPLLPTTSHRARIDPHYAMYRHQVYRDIWERPEPTREECRFWDRRPKDSTDYPEVEDIIRAVGIIKDDEDEAS